QAHFEHALLCTHLAFGPGELFDLSGVQIRRQRQARAKDQPNNRDCSLHVASSMAQISVSSPSSRASSTPNRSQWKESPVPIATVAIPLEFPLAGARFFPLHSAKHIPKENHDKDSFARRF